MVNDMASIRACSHFERHVMPPFARLCPKDGVRPHHSSKDVMLFSQGSAWGKLHVVPVFSPLSVISAYM